ncbi:MAG: dethiobiotin synthase [Dissulfurimicrobium sp.]|uniref:dethiobiotin synthase n=1 Tax=Dissulfurimicrobium TaxID=1769732 RepID=UPI001EDC4D4F|nr:dethiobiotin synthase [Dissulfurimicrobium hydrothermale]UKL13384.1 dethiobiotin synthase [Dissulfurimicrobium hydrothermale]
MIIFITGTDTDIGKTFAASLLARSFLDRGLAVKVQKWVSTGRRAYSDDLAFIYSFIGEKDLPKAGSFESPYCLSFPASPHLAAETEGVSIEKKHLIKTSRSLAAQCDILIIEGAGGALVPLSRDLLTIDLVGELKLPVVLVARSGLGTINHTLLTIEAMERRGINILCVLLNNQNDVPDPLIVNDNLKTIGEFGDLPVFGPIQRVKEPREALYTIEPMVQYLLDCLRETN